MQRLVPSQNEWCTSSLLLPLCHHEVSTYVLHQQSYIFFGILWEMKYQWHQWHAQDFLSGGLLQLHAIWVPATEKVAEHGGGGGVGGRAHFQIWGRVSLYITNFSDKQNKKISRIQGGDGGGVFKACNTPLPPYAHQWHNFCNAIWPLLNYMYFYEPQHNYRNMK